MKVSQNKWKEKKEFRLSNLPLVFEEIFQKTATKILKIDFKNQVIHHWKLFSAPH